MSGDTVDAVEIREILAAIPHRYPFLMVDRLVSIKGGESGVGIKAVTFNEPHFMGHFPGRPVMPGVLIIEGMAQTAGVIRLRADAKVTGTREVYFLTIDKAKFRRPVVPGDLLEYHVTQIANRRNMWWYRGQAKVGGHLVAEAEVGAMISEY